MKSLNKRLPLENKIRHIYPIFHIVAGTKDNKWSGSVNLWFWKNWELHLRLSLPTQLKRYRKRTLLDFFVD